MTAFFAFRWHGSSIFTKQSSSRRVREEISLVSRYIHDVTFNRLRLSIQPSQILMTHMAERDLLSH